MALKSTVKSVVGTDFIALTWKQPRYSPIGFRRNVECTLLCERQPYLKTHSDIRIRQTRMNITRLKPGTKCRVHFLLIYNPSGLDRGTDFNMETLPLSKVYAHTCTKNILIIKKNMVH